MAREWSTRDMMRFIGSLVSRWFPSEHPSPLQSAAYHEAGHAVAALTLGVGVDRVSVVGDFDTLGQIVLAQNWPHLRTGFDPNDPDDRRDGENWILLALAGECTNAPSQPPRSRFRKPWAPGGL